MNIKIKIPGISSGVPKYKGQDGLLVIFKDGSFQTVDGEIRDGLLEIELDRSDIDIIKFILDDEIYNISIDPDDIIATIPEPIPAPIKPTEGVGGVSKVDIDNKKLDHILRSDKPKRVAAAIIRGINLHRTFKNLDNLEDFCDNLLDSLCICYNTRDYPDLDKYLHQIRGSGVNVVDDNVCICYNDYKRALNIIKNYIPAKFGINPVEFALYGKSRRYNFDVNSPMDLGRDDLVDISRRTDDFVDVHSLDYRQKSRLDTIRITFIIIVSMALNFLAAFVRRIPAIGKKLARLFSKLAQKLLQKLFLIGMSNIIPDEIKNINEKLKYSDSGGYIYECNDTDDEECGGGVDYTDFENFMNNVDWLNDIDLIMNVGMDSIYLAARMIIDLYIKGVMEKYPEKYGALILKNQLEDLYDQTAFLVTYDFWSYPEPVRMLLQNDIVSRRHVGFKWLPVIEYMYQQVERSIDVET